VLHRLHVPAPVALDRLDVELRSVRRPREPREIAFQFSKIDFGNRLRDGKRHSACVGGCRILKNECGEDHENHVVVSFLTLRWGPTPKRLPLLSTLAGPHPRSPRSRFALATAAGASPSASRR
jgi:hypothetical protein